ncbi:hypothetical protein [Pseudomonas sp. IT-P4]|uniref:hypothetical protein n=1 Tax=Pseudomonas sp. IT-P4 TaxID=3026446 RepID=UPI0039DF957D
MNYIKAATYGLLMILPIAYSNLTMAGSIILGKEDGATCVLPLPVLPTTSVRYNLRRTSTPCDHFNDKVRTITFREVPSATEVILSDYEGVGDICTKGTYDFLVTLKTIKKITTTVDNIELDHLAAYGPNQIIAPGLQMIQNDTDSHLRDKLSCVKINISKKPPTTP